MIDTKMINTICIREKNYELSTFDTLEKQKYTPYILSNKFQYSHISKSSLQNFSKNFNDLRLRFGSVRIRANEIQELCENHDYNKQHPNKDKFFVLLKTSLATALISMGVILGIAAVVLVPEVGILIAMAIGLVTFISSAFLGAVYVASSEDPAYKSILSAEMGIFLLGPISPFIPIFQWLLKDINFKNNLDDLKKRKENFLTKFTDLSKEFNSIYPDIKKLLEEEKSTLDKQNKDSTVYKKLSKNAELMENLEKIYEITSLLK